MEGGALVGNLVAVEPLSDEVETTAARRSARGVPLPPALRELLIDFGTPTATAVLRFPLLRGLKTFADLRTPASGRLEILKVSRDAHSDEEGVAAFEQAIAEGDPRVEDTWWEFLVGIP